MNRHCQSWRDCNPPAPSRREWARPALFLTFLFATIVVVAALT